MVEKTAVSLLVALVTIALLQDTLSCPEENCIKPEGYWSKRYRQATGEFEANLTSVPQVSSIGKAFTLSPEVAIRIDGIIRFSKCQCNSGFFCIRKCCSYKSTMNKQTGRCMEAETVTVKGTETRRAMMDWSADDIEEETPCFGTCSAGKELFVTSLAGGENFIMISGELCITQGRRLICFTPNEFCIDYISSPSVLALASCRNATKKITWSYHSNYVTTFKQIRTTTLLISLLSLTSTFLVYSCFQELRNLHGKCLLCHMASFIAHFVIRIFRKNRAYGRDSNWICMALEFASYYFYLAPFSWLNVICFDISISFMNLRPRQGNSRKAEWMKFAIYSMYATLTPVAAYGACLLFDLSSQNLEVTDSSISYWCSNGGFSRNSYYYIPMSVYMGLSIVLFATTAYKIYRVNASTAIVRSGEQVQRKAAEESFKIYAKLLVLMGFMLWVTEPIFWALMGWKIWKRSFFLRNLWAFICAFRDLKGLYISIFFLWNDKVRNLVKEKVLNAWTCIQHRLPQPRKVKPLSRPENSSQASENPSSSNVTVTTEQGSQANISESGYMVSGKQDREFDVHSGKPVEDTPSPSLEGGSCPPFTPIGDAPGQESFSTESGSHEVTHL